MRSDLTLFVMTLLDLGLSTTYQLKAQVGLSPGATNPLLRRLAEERMVRALHPTARNKMTYELTAKGRSFLQAGCENILNAPPPPEMDAIIRIVTLALLTGVDRRRLSKYLLLASQQKDDNTVHLVNAVKIPQDTSASAALGVYQSMRSLYATRRAEMDVRVLRAFAKLTSPSGRK